MLQNELDQVIEEETKKRQEVTVRLRQFLFILLTTYYTLCLGGNCQTATVSVHFVDDVLYTVSRR